MQNRSAPESRGLSQIAAFFQFAFVPLMPWHVKIGQSKPTVDHFMWDDTQ